MKPVIGIIPLFDEEKDSIWMVPGYMDGIDVYKRQAQGQGRLWVRQTEGFPASWLRPLQWRFSAAVLRRAGGDSCLFCPPAPPVLKAPWHPGRPRPCFFSAR